MKEYQNNAVAVAEMSNRNKVLNLALQGFTIQGIVDATKLSDATVKGILAEMRAELSIRLQEAQEGWIALNMARTEKIISKVMPVFEAPTPNMLDTTDENQAKIRTYVGLIGDAAKVFTQVAKLQKDMLQVKIDAPPSASPSVVNNNTIIADSDFYKEALQHIQVEKWGQTFDDYMDNANALVDVTPTIEEDPRFAQIEAKIDKLLPPDGSQNSDDE